MTSHHPDNYCTPTPATHESGAPDIPAVPSNLSTNNL